jgi:hypothetical protein
MGGKKMGKTIDLKKIRKTDPFLDRRSGEDRREAYDLDYFRNGGTERREQGERRQPQERREDCIRVSDWSSICPQVDE